MDINVLLSGAYDLVHKHNHQFLTTDHIAYMFLTSKLVKDGDATMFSDVGIDVDLLVSKLEEHFADGTYPANKSAEPSKRYTAAVDEFIRNVEIMSMQASLSEHGALTMECLLIELFSVSDSVVVELLKTLFDADADDLSLWMEEQAAEQIDNMPEEAKRAIFGNNAGPQQKPDANCLEKYCTDLTAQAREGRIGKLIGRTAEIAEIAQILSRKNKNNAIIVGEPGVGKTQIIEGIALNIVNGNVPDALKGKIVLSLNIGSMVAGAKFRGDFEQRANDVISALTDKHILFIDEMHTVIGAGAGSESNLDFANILKPKMSRSDLRVIGTTTYDEYQNKISKDSAFIRRFMRIDVKEPNAVETRKIIEGIRSEYEKHHNVKFTKDAVDAIMVMSEKYIHSRRWPDKAIDLMDAAGARNRTLQTPLTEIGPNEIAVEVAKAANIPADALLVSDAVKMRDLSKTLSTRVFGQDEAVEKLTNAVHIARAGLRGKNTTQGGYLFVGPSGVGKTEIAKTLADTLNCNLLRFDMSEFSEQHSISKLIGSPPGYVGHSDGNGKLIDELDKNPDCVLLLDEVEKAHPDIFNLFLQALDEGSLSSSTGKTATLRNVTIIMTTNLGSRNLQNTGIGFNGSDKKLDDGIDKAVKEFFRPEFLNRLDAIVKFNELDNKVLSDVAKKFIKELNEDMQGKKVKVKLSAKAIKWVVEKGTEPGMGARPLKRVIHENVKKPLAAEILFGTLVDGGTATFDIVNDALVMV